MHHRQKHSKNDKIGYLTLKREYGRIRGTILWECQCDCGTIIYRSSRCLTKVASCGCRLRKRSEKRFKGTGALPRTLWGSMVSHARRRNKEFKITIEEGWELFEKQAGKCALSGQPIEFGPASNNWRHVTTASLDRIDNTKGYHLDNVWWVHKDLNKMKNTFTVEEFVMNCRRVASTWDDRGTKV